MLLRRKRSESAAPRRPRRRIRKLRLLALVGVLGVLALTAFSYGVVVAVGQQLTGLDPFAQQRQQVDGYVYAGDGHTILAVLRGSQSRVLVQSDQISPWMKQAIVATEDKRFYEHRGIDIRGMARALWADIRHKAAVQGGSTITQQFVKNQLTGLAALDHAQAEGGGARVAARAEVDEGQDPHRLPQHDLLRERRLRRRARRAHVLRARRDQAHRAGGGAARRHPRGPEPLRPGRAPAVPKHDARSCCG